MKVVIDNHIPYIKEAAEWLFDEVSFLPGSAFHDRPEVKEADALIIRTRTHCDEALLGNSQVRFVVTATIGHDHIDTTFMQHAGIAWTNCQGCNATSVAQYVRNAILCLGKKGRLGIVGYGHVGRAVKQAVEAIGCEVMLNDPPLERRETPSYPPKGGRLTPHAKVLPFRGVRETPFVSLQEIAEQCDIISFHTPLTFDGEFPTFHLADEDFFCRLKKKPVIINTARGGVIDELALLHAFDDGLVSQMIIDTWEGEPHIHTELLQKAFIATPHIAGYSADGKSNATRMALQAVCRHFGISISDQERFLSLTASPPLPKELQPSGDLAKDALSLYNPLTDSARLKAAPANFEALRNNYPLRREQF